MSARILIVEDELLVGMDLAMQFEDEGYDCVGPAQTPNEALELIEASQPDFAVLDVNLKGARSTDVARKLIELDRPFVYLTGYSENGVVAEMPRAPVLQKPVRFDALVEHVRKALDR